MMKELNKLVRPNILKLKPYSSARDEFKGEASVFLDANENPYNAPYNRYPDPLQRAVKQKIALLKGIDTENIFLGVGSDEPIDLLYRAFCEPAQDNVVAIDPTYGMYQVCAEINNVEYRKVKLSLDFDFEPQALLDATDDRTKIIFICSPNNPTGNAFANDKIETLLNNFGGIVAIDEAYIDFSAQAGFTHRLAQFPNLIVLQTFSKAWGNAAIRLGMAFASSQIIAIFNKIKYPYNINRLTQEHALGLLDKAEQVKLWVDELLQERSRLSQSLSELPLVKRIYPTDANFLLVNVGDAQAIYNHLTNRGIVVRNRHTITLCQGCLRITVGNPEENDKLIAALKDY